MQLGFNKLLVAASFAVWLWAVSCAAQAQPKLQLLQLPHAISGINEEFSGIAQYHNRVYLLPQYGSHKETKTDGEFNIYSLLADSINRIIYKTDTALAAYKIIKVKNLDKLPTIIKQNYQGFESITIVHGQVYLAMETPTMHYYCYLFKGVLDTVKNEIDLDIKKLYTSQKISVYRKCWV